MKNTINFKINGRQESLEIDPTKTLLKMIREDLFLTGTKEGCGEGECGACTVIFNGIAVNACLVLAGEADNSEIITVEGLSSKNELCELQKMFVKHHALQCGFCTPGMLISAKALLDRNPDPTEDEIKEAIAGNLCRCTGYKQIIDAIKETGNLLRNKQGVK